MSKTEPSAVDAHQRVHFSGAKVSRQTNIHWFRKGLRISDNPALMEALEKVGGYHYELRPLYVLDPGMFDHYGFGTNYKRFLQQSLLDLDRSLRSIGSRLFVVRGKPEEVFRRLFEEWKVICLTYEKEVEPYSKMRDEKVKALAEKANVRVVEKVSHTLYNPEALYWANGEKLPTSYMEMLSLMDQVGSPVLPCSTPIKMPSGCEPFSSGIALTGELIDVPTLKELGVDESELGPCLFPGGESEGMNRLNNLLANKNFVCNYEKPLTNPTSVVPSTSTLSPYLALGCVSIRTIYLKLTEVLTGTIHSKPPVSLTGQLIWREFHYLLANYTANFNKMVGNNLCIQIPWKDNAERLKAWASGQTGYPFVDAIMNQLRQEGWIHHSLRHMVACFLTRGDLWINWEFGAIIFQETLIDYDWAISSANWMVQSESALFHNFSFHRVYDPVQYPKKTDPDGFYVRKYIPVLRTLSKDFIYEPWNAPEDVLFKAGLALGKNYPHRIVNHEDEVKVNFVRLQKALDKNVSRRILMEKAKTKSTEIMAEGIPET